MKFLKIKNLAWLMASAVFVIACDSDDDVDSDPDQEEILITIPETITINETSLFPEGIDYDNTNDRFVLSSLGRGEVGTVDFETGAYATFGTDDNLVSGAGIFTDEENNRLLVASGNPGLTGVMNPAPGSIAFLSVFDLTSGTLIASVDLGSLNTGDLGVFANDIALGTDGNIYVTDSFSPFVYQVDGSTFEASIFLDGGDVFTPAPGGFGLNGIVYVEGSLVVGNTSDGVLYRIPLNDPESFEAVQTDVTFAGVDGMEVSADGDIVVLRNGFAGPEAGLYVVSSNDAWISGTLTATALLDATEFPTTATLAADGNIYAINAYFSVLLDGDDTNDAQETFSIVRGDL